jgi:hypothetical protein
VASALILLARRRGIDSFIDMLSIGSLRISTKWVTVMEEIN